MMVEVAISVLAGLAMLQEAALDALVGLTVPVDAALGQPLDICSRYAGLGDAQLAPCHNDRRPGWSRCAS